MCGNSRPTSRSISRVFSSRDWIGLSTHTGWLLKPKQENYSDTLATLKQAVDLAQHHFSLVV